MMFEITLPDNYDDGSQSEWRRKYNAVLKSSRWRELRIRLIEERGSKCEVCRCSHPTLQLHHLTYERFGCELDSDLQVVCADCHPRADMQRSLNSHRKSWDRRLDAWASRRYGDDWSERSDADSISDRFDDWIHRNSE